MKIKAIPIHVLSAPGLDLYHQLSTWPWLFVVYATSKHLLMEENNQKGVLLYIDLIGHKIFCVKLWQCNSTSPIQEPPLCTLNSSVIERTGKGTENKHLLTHLRFVYIKSFKQISEQLKG